MDNTSTQHNIASSNRSVSSKSSSYSYEALSSLSASPRPTSSLSTPNDPRPVSSNDVMKSRVALSRNFPSNISNEVMSNDSKGSKGSKYIWDDFDDKSHTSGRDRLDSDLNEDTSYFSFPTSRKSSTTGSTGGESLQALVQEVASKVSKIKVIIISRNLQYLHVL